MAPPQSVSAVFSAYASFPTTMMLIRSLTNELLPAKFISFLSSISLYFFGSFSSHTRFIIEEDSEITVNEVFQAAHIYLRTRITSSMDTLKVSKNPRQKNITLFSSIRIKKSTITSKTFAYNVDWSVPQMNTIGVVRKRRANLSFCSPKKFRDRVVDSICLYVLRRANEIKEENKTVRIFSKDCARGYEEARNGNWGSLNLNHRSTFDTLAMDPELKKWIVEDLDRFVRRKDFYRKVGKAWKRGYLLYGPPGTGKSSLIAAIANYLRLDIYDTDLSNVYYNANLKSNLLSTTNRSILVFEDIDCSADIQNPQIYLVGVA